MRSDAVDFGNDLDTHLAGIRDNFVVVEHAILSDPTWLALGRHAARLGGLR